MLNATFSKCAHGATFPKLCNLEEAHDVCAFVSGLAARCHRFARRLAPESAQEACYTFGQLLGNKC